MLKSCGIADRLVLKVLLDPFGRLGELTEMTDRGLLQLPFGSGRCLGSHRLLEVGVQAFVGIELGTVRRQKEDFELLGLLLQPFANHLGMMHSQVIQDQEHLTLRVLNQPLEEPNQDLSVQGIGEHHPAHFPLIGNRGNQRQAVAIAAHLHYRSLSSGSIAASPDIIGAQTRFVSPVNLGSFSFGSDYDRRIIFLEPFLHLGRSLFVGLTDWLLRCKAPSLQIVAYRAHRQLHSVLLRDQLANCRTCPQGIRHLELIRSPVADEPPNPPFLLCRKTTSIAQRATALARRYRSPTTGFVRLRRRDDRALAQLHHARHLSQLHPSQPQLDGPAPALVERLHRKRSSVGSVHASFYAPREKTATISGRVNSTRTSLWSLRPKLTRVDKEEIALSSKYRSKIQRTVEPCARCTIPIRL